MHHACAVFCIFPSIDFPTPSIKSRADSIYTTIMAEICKHNKILMPKKQQDRFVTLDNGEVSRATFPVVVSASRSTDIPAFYADWFFHRLEKGYSAWTNPFNGVKSYVGYADTRFIVFWSKNPRPLLEHLDYLKSRGIGCYIQYTLNDYEEEGLERGVRPLAERIETFKLIVDKLGTGTVVWRFDPLILTDKIDMDKLLAKIENIGDQLNGYTEKLVFSFADIVRFGHNSPELLKFLGAEIIDTVNTGNLFAEFEPIQIPDDAIEVGDGKYAVIHQNNRDKGQRTACGCMKSKDIGEYNTCPHMCEYCYANSSKETAVRNWRQHNQNPHQDTITGK